MTDKIDVLLNMAKAEPKICMHILYDIYINYGTKHQCEQPNSKQKKEKKTENTR